MLCGGQGWPTNQLNMLNVKNFHGFQNRFKLKENGKTK